MLNGRYVSIMRIVEELYGDNKYDFNVEFDDILRWTGKVLKLVSHPDIYIKKVTGHVANPNLDITDYRAKLPCDFYKLAQIAVNGFPVKYSGNTFHHLLAGSCCGITDTATTTGDLFTDNFGNVFDSSLGVESSYGDITFDINNDYITLSVQTGKVCIAYYAFPTDAEGYPMIPENEAFIEFVKAFITLQLDRIAWRLDPANSGKKAMYEDSKQEYAWYAGKAEANAKMPDYEVMETLKNQILRLKPNVNEHASFYRFLNQPGRNYIK